MAFDEQLAIDVRRALQIDIKHLRGNLACEDDVTKAVFQLLPLTARALGQEVIAGNIARQPDARGNDDLAERPGASKPFAGTSCQITQLHLRFAIFDLPLPGFQSAIANRKSAIPYRSACLIESLNLAARS